jgi:hypothetical protein
MSTDLFSTAGATRFVFPQVMSADFVASNFFDLPYHHSHQRQYMGTCSWLSADWFSCLLMPADKVFVSTRQRKEDHAITT